MAGFGATVEKMHPPGHDIVAFRYKTIMPLLLKFMHLNESLNAGHDFDDNGYASDLSYNNKTISELDL